MQSAEGRPRPEQSVVTGGGSPPLLRLTGIVKAFPGVVALDGVDFEINAGEVHALTGENGSGKSTLARVASGVIAPDAGQIEFEGVQRAIRSPKEALRLGIITISQELTLAPTLSVAENIFLGRLPRGRFGRIDWPMLSRDAQRVLGELEVHVDERQRVSQLSVELQQEVEIARAISSQSRLLILDEATSSLSEAATQRLLTLVEQLRQQGTAVLMISHRLPELYSSAGRATVLRDGRLVGTVPLPETPEAELVRMMVGRDLGDYYRKRKVDHGEAVLEVEGLCTPDGTLKPVSLSVRRGEILGVAGLVGSGKAELGLALGGAIPSHGTARVLGRDVKLGDPASALSGGIGFVPRPQTRRPAADPQCGREPLSRLDPRADRRGIIDTRSEKARVRETIDRYGVVCTSPASRITTLSGGNQQKVVLGRVFSRDLHVLVLSEPTRGVDVGAKSEIYELMQEHAAKGAGIVIISSELPELLGIGPDRRLLPR